jgi:hypothetical protein
MSYSALSRVRHCRLRLKNCKLLLTTSLKRQGGRKEGVMDGCGSLVDSLITWSIDLSTRTMHLSVLTHSDLQCIRPLQDGDWIITNVGGRVMAQAVSHRPLTPEAGRKEGRSDGWMWELGGLADNLVHRLIYTDDVPQCSDTFRLQCIRPLQDGDWIITNVGGRVMARAVSHRPLTPEEGRKEWWMDVGAWWTRW